MVSIDIASVQRDVAFRIAPVVQDLGKGRRRLGIVLIERDGFLEVRERFVEAAHIQVSRESATADSGARETAFLATPRLRRSTASPGFFEDRAIERRDPFEDRRMCRYGRRPPGPRCKEQGCDEPNDRRDG